MANLKLLLVVQSLLLIAAKGQNAPSYASQLGFGSNRHFIKQMLSKTDSAEVDDVKNPKTGDFVSNPLKENLEAGEDPYFPFAPDRGYIDIYDENNSMWYWHFRARENPDTAPVIIWLQGGPGVASTGDVFYSNGPFKFHNWPTGGKKATLRNITWIQKANVVYPDFPLGVGFSTVTGDKLSRVGKQVEEQILIFFQKFLKKYPEYKKRPLYITGLSYGGHWVSHAATALKYSNNPDINVQGFYIADGLISAKAMDESYFSYGLKYSNYTKFTQQTIDEFTPLLNLCIHSQEIGRNRLYTRNTLNLCWNTYYFGLLKNIKAKNDQFDPYFMPGPKKIPKRLADESYEKFLNNASVQKYLGVRKDQYLDYNNTFFYDYAPGDFFVDMTPLVVRLLNDGVKGVILMGNKDFITNYFMSEKLTSEFKWKYQNEFNAVKRAPCEYGLCKEYKNLREIRVNGAGHGICEYTPQYAYGIINDLMGLGDD